MKNLLITAMVLATALSSCNHQTSDSKDTTAVTDSTQVYACSMDPDVKGKKGDKCTKCGMDLTELVAKK